MKLFLLLLFLSVGVYAAWSAATRKERKAARNAVTKHGYPVAAIVAILLVALVLAFYSRSINLL